MLTRRAFGLAGLAAVGACAPTIQLAGAPGAGFDGARFELGEDPAYVAFDGTRLGLTVWPAVTGEPWAVFMALHGMNDYAEAFTLAAPVWAQAGVTTYAYDQRGFGRSPHRGVWADPELMIEDLRVATRLVRARHPNAVLAIVGVVVAAAHADHGGVVRAEQAGVDRLQLQVRHPLAEADVGAVAEGDMLAGVRPFDVQPVGVGRRRGQAAVAQQVLGHRRAEPRVPGRFGTPVRGLVPRSAPRSPPGRPARWCARRRSAW